MSTKVKSPPFVILNCSILDSPKEETLEKLLICKLTHIVWHPKSYCQVNQDTSSEDKSVFFFFSVSSTVEIPYPETRYSNVPPSSLLSFALIQKMHIQPEETKGAEDEESERERLRVRLRESRVLHLEPSRDQLYKLLHECSPLPPCALN